MSGTGEKKEEDFFASLLGRVFAFFRSNFGPFLGLIVIFLLAFFVLGSKWMLPGKPGFSLYVCWVAGLVGGKLMQALGQPPLLGMLIAGICLRNIGSPSLVDALPHTWGSAVRIFGLSVILMRSGLELDLGAIYRIGGACVRLTVCPGCSEAMMVGVAGLIAFRMPIALAFSLGFILAAVSPAVVVGGMFDLQRRGYGIDKGIPSLVVAAASFDDVVAITGYSLCIGFAISSEDSNILFDAMHGPINVGLGTGLGFLGGLFVSLSALWDTRAKRTIMVGLSGLTLAYACSSIHFTGAGALASLVTTCVAARRWGQMKAEPAKHADGKAEDEPQETKMLNGEGEEEAPPSNETTETHCSSDEHDDPSHWAHYVETDLAVVWTILAQPLLFCVIGSALNFAELDPGTIPMSIIVIGCGVMVRCPVAGLVLFGTRLTTKERSFVGLAWIPKATVQAALGGVPLDLVRNTMDPEKEPERYAKYEKYGLQILTTAVLSILITAPIGLLVIQNLGHRWLSKDSGGEEESDNVAKAREVDAPAPAPNSSEAHLKNRNTLEMQANVLQGVHPGLVANAAEDAKHVSSSRLSSRRDTFEMRADILRDRTSSEVTRPEDINFKLVDASPEDQERAAVNDGHRNHERQSLPRQPDMPARSFLGKGLCCGTF